MREWTVVGGGCAVDVFCKQRSGVGSWGKLPLTATDQLEWQSHVTPMFGDGIVYSDIVFLSGDVVLRLLRVELKSSGCGSGNGHSNLKGGEISPRRQRGLEESCIDISSKPSFSIV